MLFHKTALCPLTLSPLAEMGVDGEGERRNGLLKVDGRYQKEDKGKKKFRKYWETSQLDLNNILHIYIYIN